MTVPGSNILTTALRVIAKQTVLYYEFLARTPNAVGQDVSVFFPPVPIQGSWQAVPRSLVSQLGLDWQKRYYNFYVPKNVLDVARDISGDQIQFQGRQYQVLSASDWFGVDGWVGVMVVDIGAALALDTYFATPDTSLYFIDPATGNYFVEPA